MPGIHLARSHSIEPQILRDRVRVVEGKLRSKYGAQTSWIDDETLRVSGPGVEGTMSISPYRVAIEIDLGFMLGPLKGKLEQGLARELDRMIEPEITEEQHR